MLVTKTGSKLWRYAYNFDRKQKLLALGQYPVTSLADARVKRDDAKKLLAEGIDPSVNRKEERRNARMARANTFEAVAKELMDKFEAQGDAPKTLKKKQWLLDFANKEFGKRPIAEIKAPENPRCVAEDREARAARNSRSGTLYHTRAHIITLEQNPATYPVSMRDLCNLPSGRTRQATGGLAGNSLSVERARRLSDPLISFIWPTNSPEGRYMLAPLRSYSFLPARS